MIQTHQSRFYIGLDLGQRVDYTAISAIEFETVGDGRRDPATFEFVTWPRLCLRHLERLPLGTSYPNIARHVIDLLELPQLEGRSTLIVDATGPGIPFLDFFIASRPPANLIKLLITATGKPHYTNGFHHVPRHVLLNNLAILFQNRSLAIAPKLAETPNLLKELAALKSNGRPGTPHDDLAMATALAAWQACKGRWSCLPSLANGQPL